MASRSKSDKYWLANNPNGQVTDAQVVALKSLSNTELDDLDDMVAELKTLTTNIPVTAEADVAAPTAYSAVTDMTANVTKAEGEAVSAALAAAVVDMTEIEDKLNALLAKLRTAGIIAS
jgi:cbb3-type cytochrome oxidase cytochrome c subunit